MKKTILSLSALAIFCISLFIYSCTKEQEIKTTKDNRLKANWIAMDTTRFILGSRYLIYNPNSRYYDDSIDCTRHLREIIPGGPFDHLCYWTTYEKGGGRGDTSYYHGKIDNDVSVVFRNLQNVNEKCKISVQFINLSQSQKDQMLLKQYFNVDRDILIEGRLRNLNKNVTVKKGNYLLSVDSENNLNLKTTLDVITD